MPNNKSFALPSNDRDQLQETTMVTSTYQLLGSLPISSESKDLYGRGLVIDGSEQQPF